MAKVGRQEFQSGQRCTHPQGETTKAGEMDSRISNRALKYLSDDEINLFRFYEDDGDNVDMRGMAILEKLAKARQTIDEATGPEKEDPKPEKETDFRVMYRDIVVYLTGLENGLKAASNGSDLVCRAIASLREDMNADLERCPK